MKLKWDKWIYGLASAVIGGGSGAVVSGVSTMLISPDTFNVNTWPGVIKVLSVMAINFVLTGALSMFFFLKQSPLPPESTGDTTAVLKDASRLSLWLLLGALAFSPAVFTGCQTTNPPTKEAIVFYSFRDTWSAAHSAYQGYCELAVSGKVSARDQQDIDRAWNQFRAGFKLALLTAQGNWSATTPEGVAALKTDLITLIRSL